jgi:sphinganine-1-phosphate aldolase
MTVLSKLEHIELPDTATVVRYTEHALATMLVFAAARTLWREGVGAVARDTVQLLRAGVPGLEWVIKGALRHEARGAVNELFEGQTRAQKQLTLPEKAANPDELLKLMESYQTKDCDASDGKLFAYVYTTETTAHYAAMRDAFHRFNKDASLGPADTVRAVRAVHDAFAHENGLNPTAFPSLRRFETETLSMCASIFHGDSKVVGTLTSGGTESVLCAVKCYRDRARAKWPRITAPEVVAPQTVHPAFEKAAEYFDVKIVHVPVQENGLPRVEDVEKAITRNTILIVMSAPQYPHGIIDPVEEVSKIALKRGQ